MALLPVVSQGTDAHRNDLMTALSALHVGGKYSDLTILCNYKQWAVHKAIICSRSGFFDGACSQQFREQSTGVIDLSEDDEEAVEHMIHYLYYLDYLNDAPNSRPSALFRHRAYSNARSRILQKIDFTKIEDPLLAQAGIYTTNAPVATPEISQSDVVVSTADSKTLQSTPLSEKSDEEEYDEEHESTECESHLVLHAHVYALAEKYDIPSLKQLARQKFEVASACYYDAPELADAIDYVYTSTVDTDRGLRDVVVQLFKSHPRLASTQDIYAVIKECPNLTWDLFKAERGLL